MELWYTEEPNDGIRFSVKVKQHLHSAKSDFQKIDVFEAEELGRFFSLDGYTMMTQKDEFIYHEMIVHVPMAVCQNVRRVLVIGGGDGGTVRELLRYHEIESVDLVEIDPLVIEVCKEYFPFTASCLSDSRVNIYNEDGAEFVKRALGIYDLIIIDSTDPFGPGESLFSKSFYWNCFNALNKNGILVNQHESAFYNGDIEDMQVANQNLKGIFPIKEVYQAHIPTYSSGHWLFGFASKNLHPVNDLDAAKWDARGIQTKYYNTKLHQGAFALPNYVIDLLNS